MREPSGRIGGRGGDVTELRKSIMHPRYAIGIVFALQV